MEDCDKKKTRCHWGALQLTAAAAAAVVVVKSYEGYDGQWGTDGFLTTDFDLYGWLQMDVVNHVMPP